ncbi:hypothetical protein [Clostridium neonatale]|uniref:Uncharacterized protein n=1 Tax=Clostridium neonatale TaxID=137838 RepID=A0AA86JTN9_9CLOT|nr:hypothetical protein CNEO_60101 [Clostridium neonatale]
MNYESMLLTEVIEYIILSYPKENVKDIEEIDFNVSKGVITKRLNRKGYRKINNNFVFDEKIKNTTRKTTTILHMKKDNTTKNTELLQSNSSNNKPKKTFSTDKLDKLERLLI